MNSRTLLGGLAALALFSTPLAAKTLGLASSAQGSFTFGVASAISKVVSTKTDLQMRVQATGGSNIWVPQLNAGTLDFGVVTSYEVWLAIGGKLVYRGKNPNVRAVATMVPLTPGIFVRKDSKIQSLTELKGKRISSGFTSQKLIGEVIRAHLANAGLTYDDVKKVPAPNVVRAADDFAKGKTDALFFALGSGKILQASAKVGGVRFLSIDPSAEAWGRLQKVIPMAYQMHIKPAKRFHGVTKPSSVMAYDLMLNTHVKQDPETVYRIVKTLFANKKDMAAVFRPLLGFSGKRMTATTALPYHAGAIKAYKELGVWPK
jgi:TRAP transporter TAXI family solute receptor